MSKKYNTSNFSYEDDYSYKNESTHERCENCDRSIGGEAFYDEFGYALCFKCEHATEVEFTVSYELDDFAEETVSSEYVSNVLNLVTAAQVDETPSHVPLAA